MTEIDLNEIFSIKPSELKIFLSIERNKNKIAENGQNVLRCRKLHSFQTIKDIDPKF